MTLRRRWPLWLAGSLLLLGAGGGFLGHQLHQKRLQREELARKQAEEASPGERSEVEEHMRSIGYVQ